MKIELTNSQYRKLVKLVYIGEWIMNSHRKNEKDYIFTDIEQHIYSYFKEFNCDDILEFDTEYNMYFPTSDLDEQAMDYIDEFIEANKTNFIGYN